MKVIVILMVLAHCRCWPAPVLMAREDCSPVVRFSRVLKDKSADWSFLEGQDTLEFQTNARALENGALVHDNRLFLVSGYMNTFVGKLWKKWLFISKRTQRADP